MIIMGKMGKMGKMGRPSFSLFPLFPCFPPSRNDGKDGGKGARDIRPKALPMLGSLRAYRHIPLIVAHMGKTCFPCRVIDDFSQTAKVNCLTIKDLQNERK